MNYQIQRGTYDAYGDDAMNMKKIEETLSAIALTYGYVPIHIPTYEQTELFTRSVGESSDIVNKEMFSFVDKGGRNISLRPEMTAGVMRAIVTNKLYAQDLPLKFFYCGNVFRYERPQAGRYREFTQFGVECVGVSSYYLDAEAIMLGYNSLLMLGFPKVILKINTIGDSLSRENYKAALKEYFKPYKNTMCEDCQRRYDTNVLRILDCKSEEDQKIIANAPKIENYLTDSAKEYFQKITKILDECQIEYEIDPNLVRGLDYYSQVVFEYHFVSDQGVNLGALGGGGHYDNLLHDVGGPSLSSVGLAFGLERINTLLKEIDPDCYEKTTVDIFVVHMGNETIEHAFYLASSLRNEGFTVDLTYENKNIGAQLKLATRKKASFALIVGENEIKEHTYGVKNLLTQEQVNVAYEDLVDYFDEHLMEEHHEG